MATKTSITATTTMTIPGSENKSVWGLLRVIEAGSFNGATCALSQDSIDVTDFDAVTAELQKSALLKCGTLTITISVATPTGDGLTVEFLPSMN